MYYQNQLRDPRWQRKRLDILTRDNWTCQYCGSTTNSLNVHHIKYAEFGAPWDAEDDWMITFCEHCHQVEENLGKQNPTLKLWSVKCLEPVMFMLEISVRASGQKMFQALMSEPMCWPDGRTEHGYYHERLFATQAPAKTTVKLKDLLDGKV